LKLRRKNMSKVSEHLHAFHKAMHQDRTDAIVNCNAALDKAVGMEPGGGPHTTFLKAEIARHGRALAHHASGVEECSKAVEAELTKGDAVVPTGVSALAPPRDGGSVRMIVRAGQPTAADRPVDPLLAKILGCDQESMDSPELSLQK
jgi:hypothetical protein